ncbi:hypothetical protein OG394_29345 [Kribbella sp. NBC_01245]|uniref:hypothetical protein n=1 Tax=Kribbella sp. NBC_01245 TaxID=2903578 RepID=UPI002E2BE8D3|nr:hypothetical protein [Kribbella sp. NBC_01245]
MALLTKLRTSLGTPNKDEARPELTDEFSFDAPATAGSMASGQDAAGGVADQTESEARLGWWRRRQDAKRLEGKFESYPHLLALKPKEKYLFRSDYFQVDASVGCVLAFFHDMAAHDSFGPFWGIGRIPDGLDERVTAVVLEQVARMTDKWIDQYTKQSEKLDNLEAGELVDGGTTSSKLKARKVAGDLEATISEIQNGAAYLSVQNRLLLKAPDLAILEDSIDRISRLYIDRFGTLKAAAYAGEQRQELSGLLKKNDKKRGRGFHFTSTEFAGSYSLVTNGLNDRGGEYVGYMVGDVNNSAVLFDSNGYDHHVVIADGATSDYLNRAQISDLWCSKLSQSCLLNNGHVVHLVLDGAELDRLGPRFDALTSRVDLNTGDVNMFEMFGEEADELPVFAAQMQKLALMFEQLYESADGGVGSIIRNELEKTATQFYVDQRMWVRNAKAQRHRLRVVGIPHEQVPRLQMFVSYLDTEHKALLNSDKNDPDQLRAYNVLKSVAKNLLDNNGDLFNNHTAAAVDGIRDAKRVIYDFSKLLRRGRGVAMAQLVNIVGFAVGKLERGDTVVIHGAENIDDRVTGYIEMQLEQLYQRGGRVVFSYNDIDKMLAGVKFNKFDAADYTVFGSMRDKTVADYQELLHQRIPPDLAQLITRKGENLSYLRRGVSNVVFHLDLALGVNPNREKQRRTMQRAARHAADSARFDAVMTDKPVPGANITQAGGGNESGKDTTPPKDNAPPAQLRKKFLGAGSQPTAHPGDPGLQNTQTSMTRQPDRRAP